MAIERKKTFTYAARPSVVEKARKKAEKENLTLSEKIDQFLIGYIKQKKSPLPGVYVAVDPVDNK